MAYLPAEDRILESTTTTGTGPLALAAALTGFRRFSAVCAIDDTVPYFIEAIDSLGLPTGDYEYGTGTYSAANTLTRTTVLGSSNGGAAVNFTAGSKNVGLTLHKSGLNAAIDTRVPSSFNAVGLQQLASPGYQKLPGGLILQWGNVSATSVAAGSNFDFPIVYPIPFPSAVFVVLPTNGTTGAISYVGAGASAITTTGFNFGLKNTFTSAQSVAGSWMAIGN